MQGTSVTSNGQVTIPKAVRQKLGIRAGSKVVIRVEGNHAILSTDWRAGRHAGKRLWYVEEQAQERAGGL